MQCTFKPKETSRKISLKKVASEINYLHNQILIQQLSEIEITNRVESVFKPVLCEPMNLMNNYKSDLMQMFFSYVFLFFPFLFLFVWVFSGAGIPSKILNGSMFQIGKHSNKENNLYLPILEEILGLDQQAIQLAARLWDLLKCVHIHSYCKMCSDAFLCWNMSRCIHIYMCHDKFSTRFQVILVKYLLC